ncbi:hypothetical protein EV186_1011124 [Labedaea rhizosphaerae]|uniref:Uncharacterized protein n=1 Tax=Labedaea rhizosphaerae TaxID=598644 RepID=A0A4R6SME4_LABRH|nr:hypothetical protein EV186_1011124 [Labedaea rhizosphaerae]
MTTRVATVLWQTGGQQLMWLGKSCYMPEEASDVKKLLALAAVAGGVLLFVKRSRSAKAEADLWREATAPAGNNGAKKA